MSVRLRTWRPVPFRFEHTYASAFGWWSTREYLDGSPVVAADPCPFPRLRLFSWLPS